MKNKIKEQKISVNNINVILKFADKPNDNIQDQTLNILINSYQSRITSSNPIENNSNF